MARNLKTVRDFASAGPWTESQVRWWIFQAEHNGLAKAGAIVRLGRRVYVDIDRWSDWVDSQNQRAPAAA